MAANMKEIKERIDSVKNTSQITNAMNIVSSTKFKRFQVLTLKSRNYARAVNEAFDNLVASLTGNKFVIFDGKTEVKRVGIIVMTSDRGLCGSFNSNTFRRLESMKKEFQKEGKDVSVITIGRKAKEYCKNRDINVDSEYTQMIPETMFETGKKISEDVVQFYLNDFYDEVYMIYSKFVSAVEYNIQVEKLLPIEKKEGLPTKEYVFEPSEEEVLNSFVPQVLNIKLYQSLLENSASEHSARMSAMKQANDNASEMIRNLEVQYNRERQGKITQELTEIISGSLGVQ
ncbi:MULTISPECIES: ATP synthase F1 subunit gamma [Leptotrichia]|jgi:ATP synthase F1, gamma subunit|uniref:ATP synthase gamma chain n=1 Tax=Leptotrichia wadei TaxID=157687 RepID=A0A510KUX4_9FUSO|nr:MULTISPECIES: ATP synthase F1 subunit gamma [Leptotrichia]NWO27726.1 ATP synthase F1 subunit gamma [Leptotrichia sp. oral taxon 417]BBM55434.1 ATP synthase F1 subunit gamma [Leptotrichia wadei]VTX60663.1 ATP synthase gamma chain, sodium ion specific [uncultured Leptotrichia sp.]